MKKEKKLFSILLLSLYTICLVSCSKDEIQLVDPSHKTLNISCGSDFEIPVLTNNWMIEYVQEIPSGDNILDKENNPMTLDGYGKIEASNGWLALARDKEDRFIINLKENFDQLHDRKFVICINEAGNRDYVTITQKAGAKYKIVKSEYTEIEDKREIYVSNLECRKLKLVNNSSEPVWEPTGAIYRDVIHSSKFESNDYGAFDWVPEQGIELFDVPDIIIDGYIRWSYMTTYKKGITTSLYIKDIANGNKILMQPHTTTYLKGEITYIKRVCHYTFTIQNMGSGSRFNVSGIWTQIEPIESHTIISDNPE